MSEQATAQDTTQENDQATLPTDEGKATDGIVFDGGTEPEPTGKPEEAADGAESAPADKAKALTAEEKAQKAINKQHFKYQEERRAKAAALKELEDTKKKLAEIEANKPAPAIPPLPDPYDADYEKQVAARDKAIEDRAAYDHQQRFIAQQQETARQDEARQQQEELNATVADYGKRSVDFGLDQAEMQKREAVVVGSGIDKRVGRFLLKVKEGPLVVKYLSENPLELDKVAMMDPMEAAAHISTTIVPEAVKLKPKPSGAAPPIDIDEGGPMPEKVNPLIKGVTFI